MTKCHNQLIEVRDGKTVTKCHDQLTKINDGKGNQNYLL
jgi:hypothetical protein